MKRMTEKERKFYIVVDSVVIHLAVGFSGYIVALIASNSTQIALFGMFLAVLSLTVWIMLYGIRTMVEEQAKENGD